MTGRFSSGRWRRHHRIGIHDMSGNLWEWVSDVYAADAYLHHEAENPHYQSSGPSRLVSDSEVRPSRGGRK